MVTLRLPSGHSSQIQELNGCQEAGEEEAGVRAEETQRARRKVESPSEEEEGEEEVERSRFSVQGICSSDKEGDRVVTQDLTPAMWHFLIDFFLNSVRRI